MKWAGPLRSLLIRLIDGPKISDPLYLTNRTVKQKVRLVLVIGIPVLVIGVVVAVALTNRLFTVNTPPPVELTPAEIAARSLPDLSHTVTARRNADLEVKEAIIEPGSGNLRGILVNRASRAYPYVKVVFDLTNADGSQLGGVSTTLQNVEPRSSMKFQFPITQKNAMYVIVRELITEGP